ncbi:hypothetical protein FGO68_gene1575 [Halteria grandinella]|uniref:AIG1-type G domain-containing protein n=1 Tax=Halteria grandinella TaxID=5974 RepID=A0A8J8NRB9_HALGN|nr:hypothetical protein FGO68_gene1575 [Halteria grandinella]
MEPINRQLYAQPQQFREDYVPLICMLGLTGSGKSTFCNHIIQQPNQDYPLFEAKSSQHSVTTEIKRVRAKWFDGEGELEVIDVPGFGDSLKRDQAFTDKLFKNIKALGKIDMFILVMKNDRFHVGIWDMISIYREMFGKCWEHLIIVVTGVDFDDHESIEEYIEELERVSSEVSQIFEERLKEKSSAIVPLSLKLVRNNKKRNPIWETALSQSLSQIKRACYSDEKYSTVQMKRVMTKDYLIEYIQTYIRNTASCREQLRKYFEDIEAMKKKIKPLLVKADQNYQSQKLHPEWYVSDLIKSTKDDIQDMIIVEIHKILKNSLKKFKNEAEEVIKQIEEVKVQFDSLLEQRITKYMKVQMAGITASCGGLAIASIDGIGVAAANTFAATGIGLLVLTALVGLAMTIAWNSSEMIDKALDLMMEEIKKKKDELIQKAMDEWDKATQQVMEIAKGRDSICGGNYYGSLIEQ